MKLLAIVQDTFREALARKTIIGFFAISCFFLLIAGVLALTIDPASLVPAQTRAAGMQETAVREVYRGVEAAVTGLLAFAALFLSIFATASIIPNTLEKGAIDLLLSKPVTRDLILHGKFLGSVLIVLANIAFYVLGMFLIASLKSGFWNWGFLAVALPVTFSFVMFFPAMMVLGIASRSSALTIILLYAYIYLISPILQSRELLLFRVISDRTIRDLVTTVYFILPKPGDVSDFATKMALGQDVSWMPIWTSAAFAAALYVLAIALFRRKDF